MKEKANKETMWIVSREYAGFAEAGGVKNVVKSLAEAAAAYGFQVTVFLPRYGNITRVLDSCIGEVVLRVGDILHTVRYFELIQDSIQFIFIDSPVFTEKKDIYTYCAEEIEYFRKKLNRPDLKKGEGYIDSHEMNILFQKAVYCYGLRQHTAPHVLHCHDAHTALLPAFIFSHFIGKLLFRHTRALITIHNAGDGYRQTFYSFDRAAALTGLSRKVLEYGRIDQTVEPFLIGAAFADLTTVSPWYAQELITPDKSPYSYHFSQALAEKHIPITGITNGIDFAAYNPYTPARSELPFAFDISREQFDGKYRCRSFLLDTLKKQDSLTQMYEGTQWFGSTDAPHPDEKCLYVMYHGRLVRQKGVDVLLKAIPLMLKRCPALRVLVMGHGDTRLEAQAIDLTQELPGSFVYCKGYNRKAARLITAAADFIILPSLFEPCGLEDLIAQVYGTIPIANSQGGLQKIANGKTGFLYKVPGGQDQNIDEHARALTAAVLEQADVFLQSSKVRLVDVPYFKKIIMQAYTVLQTDFSWQHIFKDQYLPLFHSSGK
ncbi:glycogen/starch synthase [Treponema sp.]|uniref:glycogen/starch synthase n=1 Tax=Treponema sp. TaxID=166 RepID=UPI003FA2298C